VSEGLRDNFDDVRAGSAALHQAALAAEVPIFP